jgi:glucose/arabinose dehydrogenase
VPQPGRRSRAVVTWTARACALACLYTACGSHPTPPAADAGASGATVRWDQSAPDAGTLAQYSFVLYIDGGPASALPASCGAFIDTEPGTPCWSPLPTLAAGQHSIQLATRLTLNGTILESARSVALVVTVAGGPVTAAMVSPEAGPSSAQPRPSLLASAPGDASSVELVAAGLDMPTALARLPDSRFILGERRGTIRIATTGVPVSEAAYVLRDVDTQAEGNISLAVGPDFSATRQVFVGYLAREANGARVGRVARFRELDGRLGQPTVIIDRLPASSRAPGVKFGPDGALYVATESVEPGGGDDLASYAGKILRFTADGSTPPDNPSRFSPVFSYGHKGQLAFDWEPETHVLWSVETDGKGASLGRPNSSHRSEQVAFLEGVQASGVAFRAGSTSSSWRNSLFLASAAQECLFRVAGLSSSPTHPLVQRLFSNRFGRIVAVISAEDGLYFATGNGRRDAAGRPADAVYRVRDGAVSRVPVASRQP